MRLVALLALAPAVARAAPPCELEPVTDASGPRIVARKSEDFEEHFFEGPVMVLRKGRAACTINPLGVAYQLFFDEAAATAFLVGLVSTHEGLELVVVDTQRCVVRKRTATPYIAENECTMVMAPIPGGMAWSGEWEGDPSDEFAAACRATRWVLDLGPRCRKPRWRKPPRSD